MSRPLGGRLSIGALSRATGIPVETLRTWELRYGYPVPERKPSGQRVYPLSCIPRLRRIAEALSRGHRAGEVVPANEVELTALLRATSPPTPAARAEGTDGVPDDLVRLVMALDGEQLRAALLADWTRLGPVEFVRGRVALLIQAVGDAWAMGRLDVRHEHFLSECLGDLLRLLRHPFEEHATGPLVVLGALPGDPHTLGLQMAALILASAGCRILNLGPETPEAELAGVALDLAAAAVGVSVPVTSRGPTTAGRLARLRRLLPPGMPLIAGGAGAPRARPGIKLVAEIGALHAWGRRLATGARDGLEIDGAPQGRGT